MAKEENFNDLDDNFSTINDKEDFSDYNFERKPSEDSYDTFSLRTDPTPLIHQMELQLRNQYEEKNKDGVLIKKSIANTKPLCNEQGIQEILHRVKNIINNHTVQGHQKSLEEHRLRMREMADSVTHFLFSNYVEWNLSLSKINNLIDSIYFLTDMFITRTLDNKERELYGETYKENTSREVKNDKPRGGFVGQALNKLVMR